MAKQKTDETTEAPEIDYRAISHRFQDALTDAKFLLARLLDATCTMTHGGLRSAESCLACERKGVHKPVNTCSCACHKARAFLSETSAILEKV